MNYIKITETPSNHDNLEHMDTSSILVSMNNEDKKVADAVTNVIPQITKLVDALAERLKKEAGYFISGQELVVDLAY